MKQHINIFRIVILFFSALHWHLNAQTPASNPEIMLATLKQEGYVKQVGNHFIFKVQKASDTVQINQLYGALFKGPQYTVGYDVDPSYFEKKKAKPVRKSTVKEERNAATLQLLQTEKPKPVKNK
jgi:hypothetical protein